MSDLSLPAQFEYMTPDTVAECVSGINQSTHSELWSVLNNPRFKKRSQGGDGSDGTSEVPDDFSGSMKDAWPLLSDDAKKNIIGVVHE